MCQEWISIHSYTHTDIYIYIYKFCISLIKESFKWQMQNSHFLIENSTETNSKYSHSMV